MKNAKCYVNLGEISFLAAAMEAFMEKDFSKLKPVLETERLIVRPIMPEDYLDAFEWNFSVHVVIKIYIFGQTANAMLTGILNAVTNL